MRRTRGVFAVLYGLVLVACAAAPPRDNLPVVAPAPVESRLEVRAGENFYDRIAEWPAAELAPGLEAFRRSCARMRALKDTEPLSREAGWAGQAGDWRELCAALTAASDTATARQVLEAFTRPVEIGDPDGRSRFTGYFEPLIEARRRPVPPFTEPIPGPPGDLVARDGEIWQRLPNGRLRPYPARADIRPDPANLLGYAHPADVFFLQIQGSGRLRFADGRTIRAAYHATNGRPFRSTANWLMERGQISRGEASMQGIRAWMDRVGEAERRAAMNANPRYVFFEARPEGDPALGPPGAEGVPLTPLGSMAVDLDLHALGVPYLVATTAPGLGGAWAGVLVSQDTGGAIIGAVRGDLYFGTGDEAGRRAGTMNAPGQLWALLPNRVAQRLLPQPDAVADIGERPRAP